MQGLHAVAKSTAQGRDVHWLGIKWRDLPAIAVS